MSTFLIVGLSVIAWFVFGWFSARLFILDDQSFNQGVFWFTVFGPIGWIFNMLVSATPNVRRQAHFIPNVPLPSKNLRARMYGINLDKIKDKTDG